MLMTILILLGLFSLACAVATLVGWWRFFKKAGYAGWTSLVPIYSNFCLNRAAILPGWCFFLQIIPIINLFFIPFLNIKIMNQFSAGKLLKLFGALSSFTFLGLPILGLRSYQYNNADQKFERQDWIIYFSSLVLGPVLIGLLAFGVNGAKDFSQAKVNENRQKIQDISQKLDLVNKISDCLTNAKTDQEIQACEELKSKTEE